MYLHAKSADRQTDGFLYTYVYSRLGKTCKAQSYGATYSRYNITLHSKKPSWAKNMIIVNNVPMYTGRFILNNHIH